MPNLAVAFSVLRLEVFYLLPTTTRWLFLRLLWLSFYICIFGTPTLDRLVSEFALNFVKHLIEARQVKVSKTILTCFGDLSLSPLFSTHVILINVKLLSLRATYTS